MRRPYPELHAKVPWNEKKAEYTAERIGQIMLKVGDTLLRGRYELIRQLNSNGDRESWAALDQLDNECLVQTWRFNGTAPDDVQRYSWDVELRNLYRLTTSPEAQSRLLTLRDADINFDKSIEETGGYFVLVLRTPGFLTIADLLTNRGAFAWFREIDKPPARAELWRSLRNIALGLSKIHDLKMLHRSVRPAAVYLNPQVGPSSMHLGGFEWTVRLGDPTQVMAAPGYDLLPPEFEHSDSALFTIESDWFMFGALVGRMVAAIDIVSQATPSERYDSSISQIKAQDYLVDLEKDLLLRLLAARPESRLSRRHDIIDGIDKVISLLDSPMLSAADYLALIVPLGQFQPITDKILEQDPTIPVLDTLRQRDFVESDLTDALVVRSSEEKYILFGRRLAYLLIEHQDDQSALPTRQWNLGFCAGPAELRFSPGAADQTELRGIRIAVFDRRVYRQHPDDVRKNAVSWKRFLPMREDPARSHTPLSRFHEFFRATNQIELLMRDCELFCFELVKLLPARRAGSEEVAVLRPVDRSPKPANSLFRDQDMLGFLIREKSEKKDGDLVFLGSDECVRLPIRPNRPDFWKITDINFQQKTVTVRRLAPTNKTDLPQRGFLRTFGMVGQIKLLSRRSEGIKNLRSHSYLLQSLLDPSLFYIHTQSPLPEAPDPKLDAAKTRAIQNIWQTRPIYALQGPPGTGKTTLVASLLKQIFVENQVAQVLVSAQAHAAVDVLRQKVSDEMNTRMPENRLPLLAVRIPRGSEADDVKDRDFPDAVTLRMLQDALAGIDVKTSDELLQQWRSYLQQAIATLGRGDTLTGTSEMVELVKRAANITYCTTTSANLAQLAISTQSFDWSIIEESGKAHGFDLVLPLQLGHRWLLIGDHKQLPPYRYDDFKMALLNMDSVCDSLNSLPGRAGGLVDMEFVRSWKDSYSAEDKASRCDLWLKWLAAFNELFLRCETRTGQGGVPGLSSMLSQQHRMHPTIATLISQSYYDTPIESMTVDENGVPLARVTHPFVEPLGIKGRAIVWLDVPPVTAGGRGESTKTGCYTSADEIEAVVKLLNSLIASPGWLQSIIGNPDDKLSLAVLSPYRVQVLELSKKLRTLYQNPPSWLKPLPRDRPPASTVDSFQGNQANVVVVSLVRNNKRDAGYGFGFLKDASRMNVLFSRAEQLLILVGSWDFFTNKLSSVAARRDQPLGHLRLAIEYLNTCFETGEAIRISATTLTGDSR